MIYNVPTLFCLCGGPIDTKSTRPLIEGEIYAYFQIINCHSWPSPGTTIDERDALSFSVQAFPEC